MSEMESFHQLNAFLMMSSSDNEPFGHRRLLLETHPAKSSI